LEKCYAEPYKERKRQKVLRRCGEIKMTEMGTIKPEYLENHIFKHCMDSLNESADEIMVKRILIKLCEAWD